MNKGFFLMNERIYCHFILKNMLYFDHCGILTLAHVFLCIYNC